MEPIDAPCPRRGRYARISTHTKRHIKTRKKKRQVHMPQHTALAMNTTNNPDHPKTLTTRITVMTLMTIACESRLHATVVSAMMKGERREIGGAIPG